MTPRILTDGDLARVIDMASAVEAVEAAFRAKPAGSLVAPPRHHVAFPGHGDLVFTIGGTVGGDAVAGFRVYETFAGDSRIEARSLRSGTPGVARSTDLCWAIGWGNCGRAPSAVSRSGTWPRPRRKRSR